MSVTLSLSLLGLTTFAAGWFGIRRYGTAINPLTAFAVLHVGLYILLSGVVTALLSGAVYSPAILSRTALVSVVFVVGAIVPYLFRGPIPATIWSHFLGVLGLLSTRTARRFRPLTFVLLMLAAVLSFAALAGVGGGGVLWITDSRVAYMRYRAGAGPFWLLTQWFLVTAWLYLLWARRPRGVKLLGALTMFCFLAYFTGSKNNILTLLVIVVVYYHFLVHPLTTARLTAVTVAGLAFFLTLLIVQGAYQDFISAFGYFEYFSTSATFLSRFNEFGYQYGAAWLSSFWGYVPRALYSDKPYEYGVLLIHRVLFPGAAEQGHTPGALPWTLPYYDFGIVGVFVAGLTASFWRRMAYEGYLRHRESIFAFIFMLQLSIWSVLTFAPLSYTLIWCLSQALFFRLVWSKQIRRRVASRQELLGVHPVR